MPRRAHSHLACPALAVLLSGCSISGPADATDFDSVNPRSRMAAAVEAARTGDTSATPKLIDMLDASDPGQRFVAAEALERITGADLGYDPFGTVAQRNAGAQRWADWYASSQEDADQ